MEHRLIPPSALPNPLAFHGLVTCDPELARIFEVVRNVARTEVTVLVRGETGTGKELVAHALHEESPRARRPFVAVNCAAFSPTLLESELFGHKKGAFTGAIGDRQGIFEQADGGTLFLDEVAELPLELQAKLLRVLQDKVVVPLGGTRPVRADVRFVAATHRALREEVKAGRFREDLMYRLRVVPIFLPPLRARPHDVPLLLDRLIAAANERGWRHVERVDPEVMRRLIAHPWPGNVRELQNVVEHAFAVGQGPVVVVSDLPPELRVPGPAPARPPPVGSAQIEAALRDSGGDVGQAAASLGLSRTTFWRRRRALLGS